MLGGGGGAEGFKTHLNHVGKAASVWMEDMRKHAFVSDTESNAALVDSVRAQLEHINVDNLESERDQFLLDLVALKEKI